MMRRSVFLFLALAIFTFSFQETMAASNDQALDRIVAEVNTSVITQSDVNQAIRRVKQQAAENHASLPPENVLQKKVLDQLIDRQLQLQLANQMNIHVTEDAINKMVQHIAEQNHISVSELYGKLSSQGMSVTEYRKEMREELILRQVEQQAIGEKMIMTPEEVDHFLHSNTFQTPSVSTYHLQDILIVLPDSPSAANVAVAKKQAETLLEKLRKGVSLEKAIANNKSIQPTDLGWRNSAEIPSVFSTALAHAKQNDFIGPIAAPNGFHILNVLGIKNAMLSSAVPDRKQAEELLYEKKFEEALKPWIAKLRSEAFIKIHHP